MADYRVGTYQDKNNEYSFTYRIHSDNTISIVKAKSNYVENNNTIDLVEIPSEIEGCPVAKIEYRAFKEFPAKKVILPDTINEIAYEAFRSSSIEEITLPKSLKILGDFAFKECKQLKDAYVPGSVEIIGNETYKNCTSLESLTVGHGVKVIGDNVVHLCDAIKTINIPSSVAQIGIWPHMDDDVTINREPDSYADFFVRNDFKDESHSHQSEYPVSTSLSRILFIPISDNQYESNTRTIVKFVTSADNSEKTMTSSLLARGFPFGSRERAPQNPAGRGGCTPV